MTRVVLGASGAESSASTSRPGPPRPDPGGRQTPAASASGSTTVDPARAIPHPFRTSPSPTWPRPSRASVNSAARSSTPASGGPSVGTLRAAPSRWPPRRRPPNSAGRPLPLLAQSSGLVGRAWWFGTYADGGWVAGAFGRVCTPYRGQSRPNARRRELWRDQYPPPRRSSPTRTGLAARSASDGSPICRLGGSSCAWSRRRDPRGGPEGPSTCHRNVRGPGAARTRLRCER